VALPELGLHQALAVPDAAEPQVADVGLAGDVGHGHLVAQAALAEVGIDDRRELVGGTEAARSRCRADDHRTGVGEEALVGFPGLLRMRVRADGLRVGVRPQSRDLLEGQLGTRADDQIVVVDDPATGQGELAPRGVDGGRILRDELDALAIEWPLEVDAGLLTRPPADGDPRVGWRELEVRRRAHEQHLVLGAEFLAQLVGHRDATEPCAENHHRRHVTPP